ncbi:hypothetical protein RHSIM_Rhsim03G0233900 [Rhododendron simsii]|uniref:Uncharacterized protein n=1 Tax=Rhododendron simsii TaxID=118357 RepID=A0A834H868_RHOSS|nr:hypothetical protein RHSIM_Rhsim03G0233900 [Rhododendron simsii]
MEFQVVSSSNNRLKREDCFHPKHDSLFYEWKVLVGPSDWEDHSLWIGAERYRVHNLPNCYSCPGLYELGIVISGAHSGSKIGNLDPVPFYLGQSGDVRTRLQLYGRDGAHLKNGNSNGQVNDYVLQQGHGAFSEAFSRGYTIVYRWAPMENKEEAEEAETRLLNTYDYALNKGNNGVRRLEDVFQKLQGTTLDDGSACRRPPAEGRKRCQQHKGMRAMTLEGVHQIYVRLAQRMDPSSVERPSMEGRGVRSTEAKEPPSELCYIDSRTSVCRVIRRVPLSGLLDVILLNGPTQNSDEIAMFLDNINEAFQY